MLDEESGLRVSQSHGYSLLLRNLCKEVGMVRNLVWNHAWKCPSQAPAGPKNWN